jgi:hypothetical protein
VLLRLCSLLVLLDHQGQYVLATFNTGKLANRPIEVSGDLSWLIIFLPPDKSINNRRQVTPPVRQILAA